MLRNVINRAENEKFVLNAGNLNRGINLFAATLQDGKYIEPGDASNNFRDIDRAWATSSMPEKVQRYTDALAREQLFNRIKDAGSIENFKVEISSLSEKARAKFIEHHVSKKLTGNEQQALKDEITNFVLSLNLEDNEAANSNENATVHTDEKKSLISGVSGDDSKKDVSSVDEGNKVPVEAKKSLPDLLSEISASFTADHSIERYEQDLLNLSPDERSEAVIIAIGGGSEDFYKCLVDFYSAH